MTALDDLAGWAASWLADCGEETYDSAETRTRQLAAQARAEALDEAIAALHQVWRLSPESDRAPGINFAIGAVMAVRDHPAKPTTDQTEETPK